MRQFGKITLGGIQQKIFNLVLIMIILVIAAYSVVIFHQMNAISSLVAETNEKQKASITGISESTMETVVSRTLSASTQMQAQIADKKFSDTADTVNSLGAYTRILFENPERYPAREIRLPDAKTDGTATVQLLAEEGVNPDDPAVAEKIGLIGNLSDMMLSIYDRAGVDSCYVALPEGVMILIDDHASSKLDAKGAAASIPIHEREWYTGACESGGLYFTDLVTDVFTGKNCVMCSLPVYVDGKLAAVAGADLFLDNMEEYVKVSDRDNELACIVNNRGHVVFSSGTAGIFQAATGGGAADLRTSENKELAAFIGDALQGNTDIRLIEADGTLWYMTGAPIGTVGWSYVTLVNKEATDQPALMMEKQHESILSEAKNSFSEEISHARATILVLLAAAAFLALAGALILAKRIVKPLTMMTNRVVSLGGEDLRFMMEDTYRTGDEVEALAESFATLSARTLQYVDQVRTVTAEKERIGTELSLAKNIQASMLPHIFPAFPERPEFDIFASMDPAKEVGGDFYDYFLVDDDHLCMVMADVSGKGVPAALFMMASRIILANNAKNGKSPGQILTETNATICANNREEMFVTVWLGILELSTGVLTAANAGHEYPILKTPLGMFELYKDKHGLVIGGIEGFQYEEYVLTMEPGSKLFLYTDGVPEAMDDMDSLFGTERMLAALNAEPDAPPEGILKNVRRAVDAFVGEAEQFDDLTMLCLHYMGPEKDRPDLPGREK